MNKNYIVKKIKDLPLFQGTPTGLELIAFQDPATGITYKVEQNKIGGGGGTTDHQGLTLESRNAVGAHPNLEAALKQFSLQVEISGRDRFTQLFGRACNITEVLKDAGITNILVSKNGGANVDLLTSLPYVVAKNDKLEFTLTYDQLTRVALTLNCTRL